MKLSRKMHLFWLQFIFWKVKINKPYKNSINLTQFYKQICLEIKQVEKIWIFNHRRFFLLFSKLFYYRNGK